MYVESGTSGRLWITCEVFYPGKANATVLGKDVGNYSTCPKYAPSMGTLAWKESQILAFRLTMPSKETQETTALLVSRTQKACLRNFRISP